MSARTNWENIPQEIWGIIFEKLPLKSQVSLGCTCTKLYAFSLDHFLNNTEERAALYLEKKTPLPALLAQKMRKLQIIDQQICGKTIKCTRAFLKRQILRMENLRRLTVEKTRKGKCLLTELDIHELGSCQNLEELRVPGSFFKVSGENLLHFAVLSGNKKLVASTLAQIEYFDRAGVCDKYTAMNQKDWKGNTPLQLAIQDGNVEIIQLLAKKGVRGKIYTLAQKDSDLPLLIQDSLDYGSHLHVHFLAEVEFPLFFKALAESKQLLTVRFSKDFFAAFPLDVDKRLSFFYDLAEAIEKNATLLVLDFREGTNLTGQEIRPFLDCTKLEELWLPVHLLNSVDDARQNLLHLAVVAKNKKIAASLISQGVILSRQDSTGYTPYSLAHKLGHMELYFLLEKAQFDKLHAAFGKKDWEKYFGSVGVEPPLPYNILEILETPCPFWSETHPGKKIQDTHFLVFIPEKVNGVPLTLDSLEEMIQNPLGGGYATKYRDSEPNFKNQLGKIPSGRSYWMLFTKDIMPDTTGSLFEEQCQKLRRLSDKPPFHNARYRVPTPLEAAVSILTEYARSGERFYADTQEDNKQWSYTRFEGSGDWGKGIQEAIGGFTPEGLGVGVSMHYTAYWSMPAASCSGLGAACEFYEEP